MTALGNSGATISVVKRGVGCRAQGEFCQELGESVAPSILKIGPDDSYEMELLRPAPLTLETLQQMRTLLAARLWSRHTFYGLGATWRFYLQDWVAKLGYSWLIEPFAKCYPKSFEPKDRFCAIHGDATLANAMIRPWSGELLVCDPLPWGGKIPPLIEVDLGKMLQSAIGWEVALGVMAEHPSWIPEVLEGLSDELRARAVFWCAVHCARIPPYASRRGREDLSSWALEQSQRMAALC